MGSTGCMVLGCRDREGGCFSLPHPQTNHQQTPVEVHKGKAEIYVQHITMQGIWQTHWISFLL